MSKSRKMKQKTRISRQRIRTSRRDWDEAQRLSTAVVQYDDNRGLDVESTMKKIMDVLLPDI